VAKKIASAAVGLVVVAVGGWIILRGIESDEAKVRRAVEKFEQAIESRSTLSFIGNVDPDYRDCKNIDHDTLKGIAHQAFKGWAVIELELSEPQVRVAEDGGTADAYFNCRMLARTSAEAEAEDLVGKYIGDPLIVLKFVNRDGRWLVIGAEYGPGTVPPFDAAE
jgi:hypothetical protein